MSSYPDQDLPASFTLPELPPALDEWFALAAGVGENTEVVAQAIDEGSILDNLGVVNPDAARGALIGYRFVYVDGAWVDEAGRGNWRENWIVLDSRNADPIIADISTPEVEVLFGLHGEGTWEPEIVAASLSDFIATIDVNEVDAPPPYELPVAWSVWALELGPEPMKTLVSLKKWPLFRDFERAELLEVRDSLPVKVAEGLTEDGARSCVDFATQFGAVFEARTASRGGSGTFSPEDLEDLFAGDDDSYVEPAPSDQLIAEIEEELGFRLPAAYIELARTRNGGYLERNAFPMDEPTGWAEDHIAVTGLYAIGRTSRYSLAGELGSLFMRDEWGYPDWGIGIADTPTAGHEMIMLDYRESGPEGEPKVVYVDQEDDYSVTEVAPDFATFIRGLVSAEEFDDSDPEADKAAALETVAHGTLSPIVRRALAASPDLPFGETAIRRLARATVEVHGMFMLRNDPTWFALLDAMFLLHSRVATASDVDDFVDPEGETSYDNPSLELMLFFAIVDEPFEFQTRGYGLGFVEDWWDDRVASGALIEASDVWRFTPDAERSVIESMRRLAL